MSPSELLDMSVSDVLATLPAAMRVFLDHGMSCPGCPFSPFETVADAALVYGIDPFTLAAALRKEEQALFPAIRAIEQGSATGGMTISAPVRVMEWEHDRAGELLAELRDVTDGFVTPAWACQTLRALYHGLAELETSMHVHVHLENNVLFPRALQLAADAA